MRVEQRVAYADDCRPDWSAAFTLRTFAAMVAGVRAPLLAAGLVAPPERLDEARRGPRCAAEPNGRSCYTSFFKAVAATRHRGAPPAVLAYRGAGPNPAAGHHIAGSLAQRRK